MCGIIGIPHGPDHSGRGPGHLEVRPVPEQRFARSPARLPGHHVYRPGTPAEGVTVE